MTAPRSARLEQLITAFETLTPESAGRLESLYTEDAFFKDPFNEVTGIEPIRRIFGHMFVQVDQPHFHIKEAIESGDQAFLTWEFHFRMKRFDTRNFQIVRGASHLRFAADGRIAHHRDYWDVAEELYEKLPVVGGLMRWLKRQAG